jgi:hypothetical protein
MTSTTLSSSAWIAMLRLAQDFLFNGGRLDGMTDEAHDAFVVSIEEAAKALSQGTRIQISEEC